MPPLTYIPNYENYDYEGEWRDRSIENLAEKRIITKWLEPSDYCLDMAGGYGRITKTLERYFETVCMVDYSKKNLSTASMHLEKTILVRSDIRQIPFDDNCFSCIVNVRVLHHFEEVQRVLDEIVRVGRNNGTVILGVPNIRLGRYRGIKANQKILIGPQKHKAFVHPLEAYTHRSLTLVERCGTGMFDNPIGRRLNRFWALSMLDVATSSLWPLKPELFLKFKIRKRGQSNEPRVICPCGGHIIDRRCVKCSRNYGKIIDVIQ